MKPEETKDTSEDRSLAAEATDSDHQREATGDHFDVKVGDVGEGAQIAVGKSITQVGSLVLNVFQTNIKWIILLFIPVFLALAAILFILLRAQEKKPSRMAGTFNIAVAAFDLLTDGESHASEDGEILGGWLAEELRGEQPSYPSGTRVEIWGPELTGRISGRNAEERAAEAQRLAEEIGANMVIYGHTLEQGDTIEVDPDFYVATRGFDQAQEITGPHHMGSSIKVPDDIFQDPVIGAQVNRELNGRAIALSHFTLGLIHFALEDFQSAFDAFLEANETEGWEDNQGKEVIFLFLGNAALNLSDFDTAHAWFDRALDANPDYARAYIGQGLTFFQEAIAPLPDNQADAALLNQAIEAFQAGLVASDQPANADVAAKAHFGLGRSYLVQSVQGEGDLWQKAEDELRLVTDAFEVGEVRLQELAAQSYGQLGLLNYILKDDAQAITAYEQALEIGGIDSFKAEWAARLSQIYNDLGDSEAATRYAVLADEYEQ